MKDFTFIINVGSRRFTRVITADSYAQAYNKVANLYPRSAIISPK